MGEYSVECCIYDKDINTEIDIHKYFAAEQDMHKWACQKEMSAINEFYKTVTVQMQ